MRDTIEHRGLTFSVRIEPDDDTGPPWKENDGHGIVSDWTKRPKAPGEKILARDRDHFRYYDVKASLKIALKDMWDAEPIGTGTPKERAERAVNADYEYLRRYCAGEWAYIGIVVTLADSPEYSASLWGIESEPAEYHKTVAIELADQIIFDLPERFEKVERKIADLRKKIIS